MSLFIAALLVLCAAAVGEEKAQEAALRKLWGDVALLTQTLLPSFPPAAGESPGADAHRKDAASTFHAAASTLLLASRLGLGKDA